MSGVCVVATGLFCGAPASAAIPVISGTYVSTTWVFCQPTLDVQRSNGAVDALRLSQPEPASATVATESYDPASHTVTIGGVQSQGTSLLLQHENGVGGTPLAEAGISQSFSYSNDLETVTINGVVYHVVWGLKKHDVAQYFVLQIIDANGCVVQSEKVHS